MMMPLMPAPAFSENGHEAMGTFPRAYSRADIVDMVDQHEMDLLPLRERMEKDYARYRLTTHINYDSVTSEALENYAVYTSNAPRVFADKVISWQTLAKLLVRVPHVEVGQHEPEIDNLKERFAIGNLRAADERMKGMLQPSLRAQQAFYTTVRGGYVGGRCLLVKNPMTRQTYADITVWDPLHTQWSVGANGLEWVCYKIKKTRAQILSEYGVVVSGAPSSPTDSRRGSVDAEAEGVDVYDFYDGVINTVVTSEQTLKPPTLHGSPRVPAYLVLVGTMPLLQGNTASNLVADIGESVYAGVREVYDKNNDIMSIMLEIVERARRQTVVTESRDGRKTLPEDPFKQGTAISTATGEKIYTLELQKMAQETGVYMTMVAGEIQRGSLPYSSYGETPFQLSGFAITQLRQATETVLSSRIEALESMYLQVVNLLYDQFMTGAFEGLRLSGVDNQRSYFNQIITPEMLQGTCDYTIEIVSQLPQDDMAKWAQAKIAKDGQFLATVDILDQIVGLQDSQQAIDKLRSELAEQGLPEATLYTLMMAAANRGETQIAQMYLAEFQRLMAVKLGIMPNIAPGGPSPGGGRPAAQGGGGQRPEVMPNAATGAAPEAETSNQGPSFVAPRTPRPGARGQSA